MKIPFKCVKCGTTTLIHNPLPNDAEQMRNAIIAYLAGNPMGIGGGTLTQSQIASLLDATFPK